MREKEDRRREEEVILIMRRNVKREEGEGIEGAGSFDGEDGGRKNNEEEREWGRGENEKRRKEEKERQKNRGTRRMIDVREKDISTEDKDRDRWT